MNLEEGMIKLKTLSISGALLGASLTVASLAAAAPPKSAPKMFALEAFEHVKKDMIGEYEQMALKIDQQVKETEPGMLVHALTKVSENDQRAVYRWLEIFETPEALQAHLDNPPVQAHIKKLNSGILSGPSHIIIYADWDKGQKDYWRQIFGDILTYAPMNTGFFVKR